MSQAPKRIALAEHAARQLTLAQAVETSDVDGKLLSVVERDAIDVQVMQSARPGLDDTPAHLESFLCTRAEQVLRVVGKRSPTLAALAEGRSGAQWLAVAGPIAAVLVGAATDRIANPHRVDLLSLPLLALLGWNLAVYAALLAGWLWRRPARAPAHSPAHAPAHQRASLLGDLTRRFAAWHPRSGALQASVTALYTRTWYAATSALQAQRVRKVLHLAAAGWALGVVLSLFTRGLVVEYRVGWESTFLSVDQVHAILQVLLLPALSVFPFEPFSVSDIAALRFNEVSANASAAVAGARWVYLYASLLALVVMAPRLLLALAARWRESRLARRVVLNLDMPYYRRLLALAHPTRIQLGLLTQSDDDHQALVRVLLPRASERDVYLDAAPGPGLTLIRTPNNETLGAVRLVAGSHNAATPLPASLPSLPSLIKPAWAAQALARFRREPVPAQTQHVEPHARAAPSDADAALHLVRSADELQATLPQLRQLALPAVLLLNTDSDAAGTRAAELARCRSAINAAGIQAEVLDLASVARCWVQQPTLFDAIGRSLAPVKKEGFARLAELRRRRNRERLALSMEAVANQLLEGAREVEAVRTAPPSVTRLIRSSDREADALARRQASGALIERLQSAALHTQATLLRLHGLDDTPGTLLDSSFTAGFEHSTPVNTREAGMAGAATGAATGASVDLITGGLTLGAAAALGALVGGGAALAGAAWKNRSSPTGEATVQLSDDMLHALVQIALLRYLDIVHVEGRALLPAATEKPAQWPVHTAAVVAQHTAKLTRFWAGARNPAAPHAGEALARELETVMRELFHALYPAAPQV